MLNEQYSFKISTASSMKQYFLIISECGEINTLHTKPNISANGKVLTTACENGYTQNMTQSICNNGTWTVSSLACLCGLFHLISLQQQISHNSVFYIQQCCYLLRSLAVFEHDTYVGLC